MEILWKDLNFIDLLTILQLIAIRNSSDSNNIKPQAIKGLVKQNRFGFLYSTPENSAYTNYSSALECTKNSTLRPLAQKDCALYIITRFIPSIVWLTTPSKSSYRLSNNLTYKTIHLFMPFLRSLFLPRGKLRRAHDSTARIAVVLPSNCEWGTCSRSIHITQ